MVAEHIYGSPGNPVSFANKPGKLTEYSSNRKNILTHLILQRVVLTSGIPTPRDRFAYVAAAVPNGGNDIRILLGYLRPADC